MSRLGETLSIQAIEVVLAQVGELSPGPLQHIAGGQYCVGDCDNRSLLPFASG